MGDVSWFHMQTSLTGLELKKLRCLQVLMHFSFSQITLEHVMLHALYCCIVACIVLSWLDCGGETLFRDVFRDYCKVSASQRKQHLWQWALQLTLTALQLLSQLRSQTYDGALQSTAWDMQPPQVSHLVCMGSATHKSLICHLPGLCSQHKFYLSFTRALQPTFAVHIPGYIL